MTDTPRRQLAAIMFADMVGYTALMQDDESRAHEQRDRHRAILAAAVQRHHGQVLEYYGDGTLSLFASAVEAVECAIEVQGEVSRHPLIPLRIGVHSGDIVRDADGIYGDGVNVASRIEGLSAPGGVLVSGKVFDEIKNHSTISVVSLGAVRLKNIGYRLNVFAISNPGLMVPGAAEPTQLARSSDPPVRTSAAAACSPVRGARKPPHTSWRRPRSPSRQSPSSSCSCPVRHR